MQQEISVLQNCLHWWRHIMRKIRSSYSERNLMYGWSAIRKQSGMNGRAVWLCQRIKDWVYWLYNTALLGVMLVWFHFCVGEENDGVEFNIAMGRGGLLIILDAAICWTHWSGHLCCVWCIWYLTTTTSAAAWPAGADWRPVWRSNWRPWRKTEAETFSGCKIERMLMLMLMLMTASCEREVFFPSSECTVNNFLPHNGMKRLSCLYFTNATLLDRTCHVETVLQMKLQSIRGPTDATYSRAKHVRKIPSIS